MQYTGTLDKQHDAFCLYAGIRFDKPSKTSSSQSCSARVAHWFYTGSTLVLHWFYTGSTLVLYLENLAIDLYTLFDLSVRNFTGHRCKVNPKQQALVIGS